MAAAREAADADKMEELELELARAIEATRIIDTLPEERTSSLTAKLRRAAKGNFVHTDATVMHVTHRAVFVMRLKKLCNITARRQKKH